MDGMTFVVNPATCIGTGQVANECTCRSHQAKRQQALNEADDVPDWTLTANAAEIERETIRQMTAGEDWQSIVAEAQADRDDWEMMTAGEALHRTLNQREREEGESSFVANFLAAAIASDDPFMMMTAGDRLWKELADR